MKAILVVDVPDKVWQNKEKDLGMYVELWSERIDKDWYCKYFSDSLKPMPQYMTMENTVSCDYNEAFVNGFNTCIDEILGAEDETE